MPDLEATDFSEPAYASLVFEKGCEVCLIFAPPLDVIQLLNVQRVDLLRCGIKSGYS